MQETKNCVIPPPPLPLRNEKGTGAEMRRAIVSGIVTGDVSVSYWPICFPFLSSVIRPSFLPSKRGE